MQHIQPRQPAHDAPRASTSTALTLFILGTVIGLLALLGRLALELNAVLLDMFNGPGLWTHQPAPAPLAPLLRDLDAANTRLILAGFAVSTLALLAGATIWVTTGHPVTPRERIWMRFTGAIAALIWAGMFSACVIAPASIRAGAITVTGGLALIGLSAFVYLLLEFQFLASAPPLPGDDPYR